MKNSIWVWNLYKKDIKKFNQYLIDHNITEVILYWDCFSKVYDELHKLNKNIGFSVLQGDQCKKSFIQITKEIDSVLNVYPEKSKVHLDLEYPKGADYKFYLNTLNKVIDYYNDNEYFIEIATEVWNLDPRYKKIINKTDELFLMNYSKTWWKTILKGIFWYHKPFNQGIETIKEVSHINLKKEDYNKLNKFSKLFKNYRGIALHHWGSIKDDL